MWIHTAIGHIPWYDVQPIFETSHISCTAVENQPVIPRSRRLLFGTGWNQLMVTPRIWPYARMAEYGSRWATKKLGMWHEKRHFVLLGSQDIHVIVIGNSDSGCRMSRFRRHHHGFSMFMISGYTDGSIPILVFETLGLWVQSHIELKNHISLC